MIPQEFEYSTPATLQEALQLVQDGRGKVLAGGMSLIPMMKLRLATPEELVDLARIPGLRGISEDGGLVRVGAMTTHHAVEISPVTRSLCPLLAETASYIGDVQVRNMGTMGGSIAHADPAADYPAALVALDAKIRLVSMAGERTVTATEFFQDAFTTALEPGELISHIEVPVEEASEGHRYAKVEHPASGYAVIGVAARVKKGAGGIAMVRIGVTGFAARAFRARNVEQALENGADIAAAAAGAGEGEEANSDMYASGQYRRQLLRVQVARALEMALSRAS